MLIDNRFEILEPLAAMVRMERGESGFRIWLSPCDEPIKYVRVKWFFDTAFMKKVLADTWGVALADLEWVTLPLKHPAQWYFSAFDGEHTHGFGVKTGCNSFCSWEIAPDGITLTCDVRNGGEGVRLREELLVAETVYYQSEAGETPYRACQSFCRAMSHKSSYPDRPIYGFNTWYFEMRFDEKVPERVAINEAVELAKQFGGDDSPAFINGVLAKLVTEVDK